MNLRAQLMKVCAAYLAATGLSEARLSTLLFNDGKKLGRLGQGCDLNVGSFERAMLWLVEHWPDKAVWPDGVVRPLASREVAE